MAAAGRLQGEIGIRATAKIKLTHYRRDGASFIRTGCAQADRHGAESRLAAYLGQKHAPQRGPDPLIPDILLTYASEHLPYTATAKNVSYHVEALDQWWGDKRLSDVPARTCPAYPK